MGRKTSLSRRARPLPPAERKAQVLRCAVKVFARRGLQGASYAEIAREARVSTPAVFAYFPTRQRLVAAVLDEVVQVGLAIARELHSREMSPAQILLAHARALLRLLEEQPEYIHIQLEWGASFRDEVWPLYMRFQEQLVAIIASTIRRSRREQGSFETNAEDDARLVFAAGPMLAQMAMTGISQRKLDDFVHALVRCVFGDRALRDAVRSEHAELPKVSETRRSLIHGADRRRLEVWAKLARMNSRAS